MTYRKPGKTHGDWNFKITIDPSPIAIAKIFNDLGDEFKNWRAVNVIVAQKMLAGIQTIISSKGSALGKTWPQLKENYIKRKVREGHSRAELVMTGKMLSELQDANQATIKLTNNSVSVGSRAVQSRALNFGTQKSKKNIPQRMFIGWTDRMKEEVVEEYNKYALILLNRAAAKVAALPRAA